MGFSAHYASYENTFHNRRSRRHRMENPQNVAMSRMTHLYIFLCSVVLSTHTKIVADVFFFQNTIYRVMCEFFFFFKKNTHNSFFACNHTNRICSVAWRDKRMEHKHFQSKYSFACFFDSRFAHFKTQKSLCVC